MSRTSSEFFSKSQVRNILSARKDAEHQEYGPRQSLGHSCNERLKAAKEPTKPMQQRHIATRPVAGCS